MREEGLTNAAQPGRFVGMRQGGAAQPERSTAEVHVLGRTCPDAPRRLFLLLRDIMDRGESEGAFRPPPHTHTHRSSPNHLRPHTCDSTHAAGRASDDRAQWRSSLSAESTAFVKTASGKCSMITYGGL
eukprot:353698-Chlamydomonas_euryale.AAC.14